MFLCGVMCVVHVVVVVMWGMDLKGCIYVDPRDSPESLLLAGPQLTQQGGAGEEEEPALNFITMFTHHSIQILLSYFSFCKISDELAKSFLPASIFILSSYP